MAEFDAQKKAQSRSVSYSDDTVEHSSSKSKRNGTPHPKGSPHAPPSPDRDGHHAAPPRRNTHTPPNDDDEYKKNVHVTGGNGRDKEEKWVGDKLPKAKLHGEAANSLDYADNLNVKVDKKTGDTEVSWKGDEAPAITHHHQWTSDNEEEAAHSKGSSKKKSSKKTKKYKNAAGDDVEEAESDVEINTHHVWQPDSEAQAALDKKEKKEKKHKSKSSRRSSRDEDKAYHSGSDSDKNQYETRKYKNEDGDWVEEAVRPDAMKPRHNHTWTE